MGLLLVFPLIESQSRTDPSLGNVTAEVLLSCLRDCQPLSLTKEPADCLNGIEALLCSWLEEASPCGQQIPHRQKENAAAALVALACASARIFQLAANTSCGLPLKMLRKTPIYTCGTYLVMLIPPPGGSGSSATRSLFGGSSGLSSLKILASSLVYNLSDGQFASRADLIDAAGSSLGRGALVPGLGACYDAMNNMIWTCSNDYIDQWCNPGNQAFHYICQRLGVSHVILEPQGDAIATSEVINQLLHHVGAMCIHQLNLLAASNNMPITNFLAKQHPIEAHHLSSICDIMEKAMVNGDTCIIRCILVVFQVVFKFFFSPQTEKNREIVRRSGLLLWQLLMAPVDQISPEIQKEVCLAISSGLSILYPGETEINNLLKLVLTEGDRNSGLAQLRDVILTNMAEQLQNNRFGSEDDEHCRLNDELLHYILKIVVRESCVLITKCQIVSRDEFQRLLSTVPAASACLRYLMAVQNHLLSNTVLIKPDESDDSDSSLQGETLKVQELKTSILALAMQILTGCDEVLEKLQQVTTALINSDIPDREQRLKGLEQVTKATILGHLLPVLLTSLMHPNLQTLMVADPLMPQLVQLVLYTSQTALLLKTQSPVFSDVSGSPAGASEPRSKLFPDERMLEEKEEPGFLTGLKIPAPWAAGKTVETVHPVRDNYKFKETVHIPGARCLYLRFDSRCSSQYDYDKLVIYAGPNTNSRKVAEYGGNILGYGSRSVLGTGWPKDLVKVEGDTVTFSFEMRSGREHNTPDKAMWGFACTVRAQESSEDVSGGLPFLVDLALGLSVLACSMLRILYNGPEITKDEETCQELLRSKLLQRCQWQVEANGVISPALTPSPSPLPLTIEEDQEFTYPSDVLVPPVGHYFDLPRIRLPPGIMIKLREISGRARPQFRPSIREVIQPDVMEEMVVSCVIKHLNLVDALQSLINFQYQEEHAEEYDLLCKIMGETFKKLNAMERQLQSVAELEQKWQSEVEDAMHGKLENNVPFFYDYHFNESKMKELELLCSMKEISFDGGDPENMVLSLREKFFQEVNSVVQKPSHPMAKTKVLVKSLMNRAELLLHVTIAAQSGLTRSISGTPAETPACKSASETKVISHAVRQPVFLRSMSAPSDLEMIANEDLEFTRSSQRRRHVPSHRSSSFTLLQSLAIDDSRDKPTYSVLLGQLFAFIGTNPEQAVSSSGFLLAAQTRWRRGNTRKQALVHMRELLTAAVRVGGVTHLVGPVTMVLQGGPRFKGSATAPLRWLELNSVGFQLRAVWKLPSLESGMTPISELMRVKRNFLWTTSMAPCVKELLFHLLAELLRKVHSLEQRKSPAGLSSSIALQLNPCLAMLMALQSELHKLYDEETQSWVSGNAGAGAGVGGADQGRFSTYFHALMEACLAVAEVTLPVNMGITTNVMSSTSGPNLSDSSSSSSSSPGQTPQSPSLLSKRKKVKMKREKAAPSGKRSSSRAADTDPALLAMGGSKPEDMLWFHRALTLLIILRHLTRKDPQGLGVTNDAVADACQALVGATAHSRLLVISGIPTHLEDGVVRSAIRKACNAHGGVFRDEIYIPVQEELPRKAKDKAEGGECRTELEKPVVSSSVDSLDVSSSSSVTPAMSVSASASTSQASLCSSQGISRTVSDISVDQFQAGLEVAVPPSLLEPHGVSSQESLDLSLCSTGSLGSLGSFGEQLDNGETASASDVGSLYTVTSLGSRTAPSRPIRGFAVVEIRSRAKIEKIRASLFNSSDLIGLSTLDGEEELMEMSSEEILTVSTVNQSLFDTQGSPALEDYFGDKTIKGDKLVPGAREVLTDIFKSCLHSEQMLSLLPAKPTKVMEIYLSKEQINAQAPGNLLHTFFTHVRPPKKALEDQLTQILRKYGVPRPKFDKSKYSKGGKEQHPVKVVSTKRPVSKPPAKEKAVLNSVSRTALSEKKPTVKARSPEKGKPEEKDPDKSPTKKQDAPEEKYLTLEGFHRFVIDRAKQDIRSVWRAILSCGYDLHFERCACLDARHAQKACRKWSLEMDVALVRYINRLCRHLAITPARLHPHEVYLDSADAADPQVSCLLSIPIESLRLRFALLQSLNTTLETFFLPLVELRQTRVYPNSIAALLQEAKGLIFYDTKVTVLNRVLNATVQRTADHAAPEITLDPLEIVGGEIRSSENSYFCQAARQLACVPSSQLCVKLASGGDPTYAFNIRFTGEEVHGTSGSFRHFLWQVCKELQSTLLSLLLLCPSSSVNKNKGKYILTPSPISYGEEQLLHFFGQLLGIAIRADVPLPLDLLPSFWKILVGEPLEPDVDLQEADVLTYNYVKKFENLNDETELEALCAEIATQHLAMESPDSPNKPSCKFTYVTMTGEEVELCARGRHIPVVWENKDVYAAAIRNLRLHELQTAECVMAVRAGLASIIPLQILTLLTPLEMELRTCGLPYINLEFLKAHTMYQVGLMETDQHIEFFWGALEMFTQEELCKFIKFACNQERIPFTCPCKDGGPDTAHVPPYPMKIAPPDGTAGSPDSRYIRVETCMFMIKLPQYSSLEIMLEKLRYAIHYREDPLSG
ncbi:probable E3 ubiquitin-protein ligase HECTD4 [Notechis scutatus]|uniref:Probable E3 ubiquitin-protein ligase HECTD4 n=1 Tax=Notechis scutatus TaxID=8663 RepID=A0A6J1VYB3_9SAUR|nr:probable E3 ubiquitin-protein ligase HECTD4 [Notechis scutatus]